MGVRNRKMETIGRLNAKTLDARFLNEVQHELNCSPFEGEAVLTHRTEIVRLALQGKTTSQICNILHHCPQAVENYLSTFVRCVQLARKEMQPGQIAFLLRRGKALVQRYLDLLAESESDKNMARGSRGCVLK